MTNPCQQKMVIDWYNYCREVCADRVMNHNVGQIGGPGTTVEIDESKFGKTKYNHSRCIKGQWVFSSLLPCSSRAKG